MVSRVTSLVVVAALAVGCDQAAPRPGATGQEAGAPAAGGAPSSGDSTSAEPQSVAGKAVDALVAAVSSKPRFHEVIVPAGTAVSLTLETAVGSDTSRVEDTVRAKVAKSIMVGAVAAVPAGADAVGSVTGAERSGKVKGRASLSLRFNRLTVWDETQEISTARISRLAAATKGEDATKIGIGAGAGALIGAIAGGKKGAAIGGAVGAGGGTGVVMATRGDEVRLPVGTTLRTTLQEPLTVRIPVE